MSSPSEARRRKRDPDRERASPKPKDKDRDDKDRKERKKRSSRKPSSTTSTKDDDSPRERRRPSSRERRVRAPSSSSTLNTSKPSSRMAVVPELDRRASLGLPHNGSRSSLSYPTFSKTHSKEDPYAKESAERRKSPLTPEPTDIGDEPEAKATPAEGRTPPPTRAPPSPPLTATTAADLRKTASTNSMRRKNSNVIKEMEAGRQSVDSGTRLTPDPRFSASRSSLRETDMDGTDLTSTTGSQPSTVRAKSPRTVPQTQTTPASPTHPRPPGSFRPSAASRVSSRQNSIVTQSTDSEATSVGTQRPPAPPTAIADSPTNSDISPASAMDSSPRTPTQHSALPSVVSSVKDQPPTVEIITDFGSRCQSVDSAYQDSPMTPPPPPPPPMMPMEAPRVDYLLQNGGLPKPVPRSLLAAIDSEPVTAYSHYMSPRMNGPQAHDPRALFGPLQKILDDYSQVMDRSGSLAVATGYRSVARRLLDRLEAVFARNISSEFCQCVMCLGMPLPNEEEAGVNWGEILELVSGRCDLPVWPPFDNSAANGLGISDLEAPCQRIDVDVPSEYRAHYAHQSQKTKVAVQSWLSNQQDTAPEEADDETLTFAMLTRLEQERRPLFYALLYGMDHVPNQKTQPIPYDGTPPSISKAALALQRLYRLYAPPRDQLVVMYLINNPDRHNILATLSAVTKQEWEILISGRFDGFLWSGAETFAHPSSPAPPSRGPSRGPMADMQPDFPRRFASPFSPGVFNTFSPSASPYPGSRPGSTRPPGPAPVQVDEDTEIAVLAEIEREIYLGMEAMEDAFETLHNHAEVVRRRLRERGAALSMVAQTRRGPSMGGIEVRMDTPAGVKVGMGVDQDENLEDLRSEIGPDDSASNVSHNRRRRGHRSRARHTPAPVEEEEEEGSSLAERIRRRY